MKRNFIPKNTRSQRKKVHIDDLERMFCAPILLITLQNEKFYYRVKKNELDAQLILSIFRQRLQVSGASRPIIRRHNCMYTTIGLVLIIPFR